jgi:hypothetical protein
LSSVTDQHSETVKPSWFGESIGRYENGELVVDTVGLSTSYSFIDNFRTPHSEKEHVVERYKISVDGNALEASVMVEDPDLLLRSPLKIIFNEAPLGRVQLTVSLRALLDAIDRCVRHHQTSISQIGRLLDSFAGAPLGSRNHSGVEDVIPSHNGERMVVDPRRRSNGNGALLRRRTTVCTIYVGMIAFNLSSSPVAAADIAEPHHKSVERVPLLPSGVSGGESERLTRRRFDAQQMLWKEPHRNDFHHNASKAHLSDTTGASISPRSRSSEKLNTPPPTDTSAPIDAEKEQLFQQFLQWQKRP